jgi:uncharacterized membrane protein YphA (DoxX/SURF4 family)
MSLPVSYQGRSFLFNVLFVVVNLIGLTCLTMGFHDNFEPQSTFLIAIGVSAMVLSATGLIIFQGRVMMAAVARVLVGGLCIVSGLVKANDPIGFAYKLEEYFEDGALAYRIKEWFHLPGFSLEFLLDYALILSVIICTAEIVLGVLLVIAGKIKIVSYLALGMLLFFTFLTWHTANCDGDKKFVDRDTYAMSDQLALLKMEEVNNNPDLKIVSKSSTELVIDEKKMPQCVNDCGCFGDAMKGSVGRSLTPHESFWKDLILVYLVLWIFLAQWIIKPNTRKQNLIFCICSLVLVGFFAWVFGWWFPLLFAALVLLGALWILRAGGKVLGSYMGATAIVTGISLLVTAYVLLYEPLKDYRPYAVGNNLIQKMNDGVEGKYESMLLYVNKKTGDKKEYSATSEAFTQSKIWEQSDWEYKSMVQKTIVETKQASIPDFEPFINFSDIGKEEMSLPFIQAAVKERNQKESTANIGKEENEYAEEMNRSSQELSSEIILKDFILKSDRIVMLFVQNLGKANWSNLSKIKTIQQACVRDRIPFVVVCNASRQDINHFKQAHDFKVPIFVNDEKTLQAISRSNPSLVVLENAIVKAKFPHRSIPTYQRLKTTIFEK